jgi:hypothetical protein
MADKASMLGAWIVVENTERGANEDLNLTVGGTIHLNTEALRLLGGKLLTVKIEVYDADSFYDDKLKTDTSFQIGIHDTGFHCFHTGVIVPHGILNDCEFWNDDYAEIYALVSASAGAVKTNGARSQQEDVKIYP